MVFLTIQPYSIGCACYQEIVDDFSLWGQECCVDRGKRADAHDIVGHEALQERAGFGAGDFYDGPVLQDGWIEHG